MLRTISSLCVPIILAHIKKLLKKKLYCQTYMGHSKTALDERQSVNKGEFRFPIKSEFFWFFFNR